MREYLPTINAVAPSCYLSWAAFIVVTVQEDELAYSDSPASQSIDGDGLAFSLAETGTGEGEGARTDLQ